MTLIEIRKRASKNWLERQTLITALQQAVLESDHIEKINAIDPSFIRKLFGFPGDITTHRIATVLKKINI